MKFVSEHFTREKLTEALKRIYSGGENKYDRQRALNLLVQLKSPEALQDISNALNASDSSLSIEVASMLTQYLVAYETQEAKSKWGVYNGALSNEDTPNNPFSPTPR